MPLKTLRTALKLHAAKGLREINEKMAGFLAMSGEFRIRENEVNAI